MKSKRTLKEEYEVLERIKQYLRDCIDGLLNKISVIDDENERHLTLSYIINYVNQYIEESIRARNIYKEMIKELEK